MNSSIAKVPTAHASKYLQQVCKHWAHNLEVVCDAQQGTIRFPKDGRGGPWPDEALVTLTAGIDALECRIDASVPEQRDGLKGAVARHVDRFAFREAPLPFEWQDI